MNPAPLLALVSLLLVPQAGIAADPGQAIRRNSCIPARFGEIEYLTGRFDPADHPGFFRKLPKRLTDGRDHYLRAEAAEAFLAMAAAAEADGVKLKVISSFRSYAHQQSILKRKVAGKPTRDKIERYLEFSALPGTSRHHWGTEVDLNALSNEHFKTGEGKRTFAWLARNAASFGFALPYTEGRPDGHKPEAWHWSYTPLSVPLLSIYNEMHARGALADEHLGPFAGELRVVERFVNGIDPQLVPVRREPSAVRRFRPDDDR